MSTSDDIFTNLDDIIGPLGSDTFVIDSFGTDLPAESSAQQWSEPGYVGTIDYRIRQLSYSSLNTFHSCPRKFQLYKLQASRTSESKDGQITFSFGHAVGHAIQQTLVGKSEAQVIWELFLAWPHALDDSHGKYKKSFWEAVIALQKFRAIQDSHLSDYEVLLVDGVPAIELSLCINFPDGFRYRGHIDTVLRHKHTGEILVLELKTTGLRSISPAQYKNSGQALGYSVVLDSIYPGLSSYKVLYLVYQTESRDYHPIYFTKTYLQRALWLREILLDIETIKLYEQAEVYPMRGSSCFDFMRECEYLNTCTMSTPLLTKPCTPAAEDTFAYTVNVSLLDLLNTQLKNVGALDEETI